MNIKEILNTYQKAFEVFLTKTPSRNLLLTYLEGRDNGLLELEDFIVLNIKRQTEWLPLNAVLGAVELMVNEHIDFNEPDVACTQHIVDVVMKEATKGVRMPKAVNKSIDLTDVDNW